MQSSVSFTQVDLCNYPSLGHSLATSSQEGSSEQISMKACFYAKHSTTYWENPLNSTT